jgi:hypothetical protein
LGQACVHCDQTLIAIINATSKQSIGRDPALFRFQAFILDEAEQAALICRNAPKKNPLLRQDVDSLS